MGNKEGLLVFGIILVIVLSIIFINSSITGNVTFNQGYSSCYDSDKTDYSNSNDDSQFTFSSIIYQFNNKHEIRRYDFCFNGNILFERYCKNDIRSSIGTKIVRCENGCYLGACKLAEENNSAPQGNTSFNVLVIGWDGTQRDHFWECYNKKLPGCENGLPNLKRLSKGKIFNTTITNGVTATKPGWAQILSGYDAEITGVYSNENFTAIPEGYTVFEKLENNFGDDNIVTIFLGAKGHNLGDLCKGDTWATNNGKVKTAKESEPWCNAKNNIDIFENHLKENDNVVSEALPLLEQNKNKRIFGFILFYGPDHLGHHYGENSQEYTDAILNDDKDLGKIIDKLKELGIYDRTYIYVTTDHGFDEGQMTHRNAPYTFLATNDPAVVRGGDRKDIAPTILAKFGVDNGKIRNLPSLSGISLYSIPTGCVPQGEAFVDYSGAPQCCFGLQVAPINKYVKDCLDPTGGQDDNSGYCTILGDGICGSGESICNSNDCASLNVCGDGICSNTESYSSCTIDCSNLDTEEDIELD
ncbi:alkaline phosphatase family protein [Candidatus Pacearchaeota archaeon]|nr:alkaline phosphatase family protein [Candidatus Pacearchaeota archaeon]